MKQIISILSISAIALMAVSSCQKENEMLQEKSSAKTAIMTVNAGSSITKTAVTELASNNYSLSWTTGDAIAAYEVSSVASVATVQPKVTSSSLTEAADNATFTMDFSANEGESDFSYIFVYPAANYNKVGSDYLATIPTVQTFKSASFDPDADLLISKPLAAQATRPTSVNAQFERIGATVVMYIKAPLTEEKIRAIYFSTTEGNITGSVAVDPLAGTFERSISANQASEIELIPESETKYTGTIPVWFRMGAIDLSNNFKIVVDTDAKTYTKTVDLASAGKTVKFENSGLTKFNVDMTGVSGAVNKISISSANIKSMTGTTTGYGVEKTVTVSGNIWASTGYKSAASDGFVQLKPADSPYLEIPPVEGIIRKIVLSVTASSAESEGASTVNSTMSFRGDLSGENLASSSAAASSTKIIDISGTNYRSGYVIVTGGNVARVWSCTVYYTADDATVSNLDIVDNPTKSTYTTADDASDINFAGGKAIATFSNGSVANVSRLLTFSCDFSSTGTKTVTASYEGHSDTFNVSVEEAGDPLIYTLDATKKTSTGADDTSYTTAVNYSYTDSASGKEIEWNVMANSSQEPWRFGGKGASTTHTPALYSKTAISENISKVEIESGTATITVNSITLNVYNSAAKAATGGDDYISTETISSGITSNTITFNRPDGKSWEGCYYRIVYNLTSTAAKSNQYLQLNYVKFYGK